MPSTVHSCLASELLDHLLEGCHLIGNDFTYLYVNDAAAKQGRMTKEQLLGRTMMQVDPGVEGTAMFAMLKQVLRERRKQQMESEFLYPDGTKGWFELRFEPVQQGVLILSIEVTAQKLAEAEARANEVREAEGRIVAQKMEAIGQLAGGIAHGFNNLMSVVLSYAGFVTDALHASDPMHADVEEIKKAGNRAVGLTKQLLAFSRKQVLDPQVIELNRVASEMESMLQRVIGEDIELEQRLAADLGRVKADPGQIEQVIMHLVVNARDAMPNGGKLTIETANVELDATQTARSTQMSAGSYVMLAISDTGMGMDPVTQQRSFEPFFTTKDVGKGTGLGLSTVYGIIKQSGGYVSVYSEPRVGTTFKIYLPRVLDSLTPLAPLGVSEAPAVGTETILLVEDDQAVRNLTSRILRAAGYQVLSAANGGEALLMCEAHPRQIALLVTDVVMPQMGGRQLAERLHKLEPGLRVLYMSGYTDNAIERHGVIDAGSAFIAKPFSAKDLTRKVRAVIDGKLPTPK